MDKKEHELKALLTGQTFDTSADATGELEVAKVYASGFANATEGIAVVSDFRDDECYIYSGEFGQRMFSLPEYSTGYNTAFEDVVLSRGNREEFLERHILELRFFNFIKDLPLEHRSEYQMSCLIRFGKDGNSNSMTILHTSRYLSFDNSGNVILGLCTYVPFPQITGAWSGNIINVVTGELVNYDIYIESDKKLLSKRQLEILRFLAKGLPSKQIADQLNLSLFTVNRHRQDILACLKVANTAAAVEIGLRMGLI